MKQALKFLTLTVIIFASNFSARASERDLVQTPVPIVLDGRLHVQTTAGSGDIPVQVSRDWTQPQQDVTRAVIVVHGWPRRDLSAADYLAKRLGEAAQHTVFITPQFLTSVDVTEHKLPAAMLQWGPNDWHAGYDAQQPAAISSFDAMDEIFHRLADRKLFPNLQNIVLAGHSGGAQFTQRYAVTGHGDAYAQKAGIHVRYVIANPGSYLYFSRERPTADGGFAVPSSAACATVDRWNHGIDSRLPRYVQQAGAMDALERAYLQKDVVYLLGTADNDPDGDGLDKSCGAEVQGKTRYARGLAYFAYIHRRDAHTPHQLFEIPGVNHHSHPMYGSACGLSVLFGVGSCGGER